MGKKIVFLDRDGVINKLVERDGRHVSPRTFDDFEILPGVRSAIKKLREDGFVVVVATNQPDISRGYMDAKELELMHKVVHALGVHEIRFCPHSDEDSCVCRKPKSGLFTDYLRSIDYVPEEVFVIGDSESDLIAGASICANLILIGGNSVKADRKFEYKRFESLIKVIESGELNG